MSLTKIIGLILLILGLVGYSLVGLPSGIVIIVGILMLVLG